MEARALSPGPELLLVVTAAFLSGIINATVGGGGLMQLTALLAAFPQSAPATLLGTNKLASIAGTAGAVLRYAQRVTIPWRLVLPACALAFAGSLAGAFTVTRVPAEAFRSLVPVMLAAVLAWMLMDRRLGTEHAPRTPGVAGLAAAALAFCALGFFDGFFGPGVGTFLIVLFVRGFGFDFLRAAACSRAVNLASNLAAIGLFAQQGRVSWTIGAMMALANVAGAVMGTRLAIRHGNRFLRRLLIVAAAALIAKTAWDAWV